MKKGDLIFYNKGESHCLNNKGDFFAINILINPGLLDDSLVDAENMMDILTLNWFNDISVKIHDFNSVVSFKGQKAVEIQSIFLMMLKEYDEKISGYERVIYGYLNILFTKLFRQLQMNNALELRQDMKGVTKNVLEYIEKNYDKKITLAQLAKESFYQPSYFSKIFKECYGMPPMKYVNKKRINHAVWLLINTDDTVDSIMHCVGYLDRKHFYAMFKSETGLTPGAYRKMKQLMWVNGI